MAVAALAPVFSIVALRTGWGSTAALSLAAVQLVAVSLLLGGLLRGRCRLALLLPMLVAGTLAVAAAPSAADAGALGLTVAAGSAHALCYGGLLLLFGASLLPGREALVTGFARRLNPHFHDGMRNYTRGVTWAWCLLFAVELLASAALLRWAPAQWPLFANAGHLLPVLGLAVGEYALRRRRFGSQGTDLRTMLAAARRGAFSRPAAGAAAARAAATGSPASGADA